MSMLLFLACQDPSDAEDPSPYLYEDTAGEAPAYTADAVATAVQGVWNNLFSYQADAVFVAYDEVMAYSDEACPALTVPGDGIYMWETTCTAATGAEYSGFYNEYRADAELAVRRFRAEATVVTPDGASLTFAGEGEYESDPTTERWSSSVNGVMNYDGPAAEGTWLDEGVELSLMYEVTAREVSGGPRAQVEGALSGLAGDVSAMSFTDVAFPVQADTSCVLEPTGSMAIRDAAGVWADLVFDLQVDNDVYSIDEGLCDGCGTLWFGGVELGQVCLDATAITDAALPPW